jgi:Zn ribbon nucleic-acid-binding protein
MDSDFQLEDWVTCPNCFDNNVDIRAYRYNSGIEFECETCGEQTHKTAEELEPDIG